MSSSIAGRKLIPSSFFAVACWIDFLGARRWGSMAYISQPMKPMKMSAGSSIKTNALLRLRLTLRLYTKSAPDMESAKMLVKL